MKKKLVAVLMCAVLASGTSMSVCAEEKTETAAEETKETGEATESAAGEAQGSVLSAPTDFTADPNTGEFSFKATDERMGYYFVRVYHVDENGKETGEYVASSKRIKGGSTGDKSGTLDVSGIPWGTYHINLVSFAPAGTDYESPGALTLTAQYGIGKTLERPEMMAMTSGNQAELIVDWYTLADYFSYEYLPDMKFTFYSDAECTQEIMSDSVDLSLLPKQNGYEALPPANGYVWGWAEAQGQHQYTVVSESEQWGSSEKTFSFKNDVYTYNLDPGTYYVTAQALAKDEYTVDSQVSTPIEIVLTDGESTEEFETVKTELWKDPVFGMDRMYASAGVQEDRVNFEEVQEIYGELL